MTGRPDHLLPAMLGLCLLPVVVVCGALAVAITVVEVARTGCPCGCTDPRHARTHGSTHASTHGAHTAVTAPDITAGQTHGRGLTPA